MYNKKNIDVNKLEACEIAYIICYDESGIPNKIYVVTKDNQEIYRYNGRYYEPNGEQYTKAEVQEMIGAKCTLTMKNNVISCVKDNRDLWIDRNDFNKDKELINLKNGIYNIKTKELTFTNAGLIEPLIKSGGAVEYIETAGSKYPLGLVEDNTYQEKTVHLKTGDVLILLTDGIPEAQNHAKELYGDDKLKTLLETLDTAALSAKEIKEKIIEDARRFSGKAPQHDDVTVIVVKGIG